MKPEPIIAPAWGKRTADAEAHFWSPNDPDWRSACGINLQADLTFAGIPYLMVEAGGKHCAACLRALDG